MNGSGDFASSMFWKLFSMFLLFFYTDVFGISAAAVGTMFLVTSIWDAVNDPLMGIISDRTRTRWGKFRPYLLFVAIPFAIAGIFTFSTPDLSVGGKLIYAYITYSLMMMVYTAVNVPYSSLMGVMTTDPGERTSLASFRFIGAFAGGILIASSANALTGWFLAAFGFEANVEQSADSLLGIRLMISIIAGLGALPGALFMLFYKLDEEFMTKVSNDLMQARQYP